MDESIKILAIDPGSHCGYCVMTIPKPVPTHMRSARDGAGIWNLQQKRFEGSGMRYVRLRKFIAEVDPDFVVYEQVNFPHKSTQAAAVYWGIVGAVTSYCEATGIEYGAIATGDLKRRATGKGGGKGTGKPEIIRAANVFFDLDPPFSDDSKASNHDHDIADAMWLMQVAIDEFAPSINPRTRDSGTEGSTLVSTPRIRDSGTEGSTLVSTPRELIDALNKMSQHDLDAPLTLCSHTDEPYGAKMSVVSGMICINPM